MKTYTVIAWRLEGTDEYEVDRTIIDAESPEAARKEVERLMYKTDTSFKYTTVKEYEKGDEFMSGPSF